MTSFTLFRESNDHEGESWTFWLQRDGNEDALSFLAGELEAAEKQFKWDFPYKLELDATLDEHDVDVLCEYGGQGYMDYHNKIVGKLVIPEDFTAAGDDDFLYKGGVSHLFHED